MSVPNPLRLSNALLRRALKRAEAVMQGVQDVAPTQTMGDALAIVREALRVE